jgi:hypothetical protein
MHGEVIERLKPEPFVRGTAAARPEQEALLPALDDPYQASGLAASSEVSRLVIVMGREGFKAGGKAYHTLQYVHIGLGEFGFWDDGHWFNYVFSDIQPKLVTVRGRNLVRIFDYIGLRRMPWIRVADRDFRAADDADDGEPVITRIEVTDWVPPKKREG